MSDLAVKSMNCNDQFCNLLNWLVIIFVNEVLTSQIGMMD